MEDRVPLPATETSSAVSALTGNDVASCDFVEQEASSIPKSQKKESSKWTNEKHSLYLKSMEASFVNQLYGSSDTRCWKRQKDSTHITSDQFKVLHHGFWSKINCKREEPKPNTANRAYVSPGNPWIQLFRNESKHVAIASPSLHEKPTSSATSVQIRASDSQSQLSRQDSGCNSTEVTDQNFVEADATMKKAEGSHSRKRTRSRVVSCSGNDQVVPFGSFPP